jgi:hypothetical protein
MVRRRRIAAAAAVLFGLATVIAGAGVLSGRSDPGYPVFLPLLFFNTLMGLVYVAAGLTIWRSRRWGQRAAAGVLLINLAVLTAILLFHARGGEVAPESLRAMAFRTVVWLGLFGVVVWRPPPSSPPGPPLTR